MESVDRPLIVIVGPTASGKTNLAVELAECWNGEIICADSRTVYKGMDIGTAKPSAEDQARVPHWGLDLVEPGERFSAADFKLYATSKIRDIRSRGKTPFLVGGTGLYIDSIIFDYQFGDSANPETRALLEAQTLNELIDYCTESNIELPENSQNKRYIIRAIEQNGVNHNRNIAPIENTIIVGIATDKDNLLQNIVKRTEQLFDHGVVEEATTLGKKYGWNSEAMTGNIYPLLHQLLDQELTLEEVKTRFNTADWHLAKRQLTWLRRNPYIKWLSLTEARDYLTDHLAG